MRTSPVWASVVAALLVACTPLRGHLPPDGGASDAESDVVDARDVEARDLGVADDGTIDSGPSDNGPLDNGSSDNGPSDSGPFDNGSSDNGPFDNGSSDNGPSDNGPLDSGPTDAGTLDTGPADAAAPDSGPADAAAFDSGPMDAGPVDAGPVDGGAADAGPADSGPSCPVGMRLIAAGQFVMGDATGGDGVARPAHGVRLSAYCIDLTEVTVAAYGGCTAGGCTSPATTQYCNWGVGGRDDHPINCVTWEQARAFCQWRGGELPTEAQWEYAARGNDGRIYPWGDTAPGSRPCWSGNGATLPSTCPVGSSPAGDSFFGLSDMAGGLWEFVLDSFGGYTGDPTSFALDPVYLEAERDHIVRGGAWRSMLATEMLSWGRTVTGSPSNVIVGFRCARAPR